MRFGLRHSALLALDLALIAFATLFALALRENLELSLPHLASLFPYLTFTLISATFVLLVSGLSRSIWRFSVMADYLRVVACVVVIVLSAVALGFLFNRLEGVARALPVIQGLLMAFLLVGIRVSARLRFTRRSEQTSHPLALSGHETVLIVGINPITDLFLRSVAEFASERINIAGLVGRTTEHGGRLVHRHRVLGAPEDISEILKDLDVHGISIDRVVVTMAFTELPLAAQNALLEMERTSSIRLDLFAEHIGLVGPTMRQPTSPPRSKGAQNDDSCVAFGVEHAESIVGRPYWRFKRLVDMLAAAAMLILLMPLILVVGLVVALDVGLPTVFWQQRPGMRARPFKLYKFRTMRSAHDQSGERVPDEQRLSSVGRFLRRTHLDELPQLYNILIGEMSFVGPRPLLPPDQGFAERLLIRPGLTGWAQVNGGREITARGKAALDLWYARHASLWLDLTILVRTIPTILFGEFTNDKALQTAWRDLSVNTPLGGADTAR